MNQPTQKPAGVERIIRAFFYSLRGLQGTFNTEAAFRQELILAFIMVPLAFWLGNTPTEQAILIGTLLLVLIVELLNSAIEAVVDRIGPEFHELSGKAKDAASAAVLLTLVLTFFCWSTIAISPLIK